LKCCGGCGKEIGMNWVKDIAGAKAYCRSCSKQFVSGPDK